MNASSLTDLAYQGILALAEKNRLAPDDKLPGETTLAALIGVSRPVIRQALARLHAEGRVIARKGAGNFLGRPQLRSVPFDPIRSVEEVRAFLEYRCVIEGECAASAASCRDGDLLGEINARKRQIELAVSRGAESIEEDIAFHEAIAKASGNKFYAMTLSAIRDNRRLATRITREVSTQPRISRLRDIVDEHAKIAEAVERQDEAAARDAMVAHIRGGIRRLLGTPQE